MFEEIILKKEIRFYVSPFRESKKKKNSVSYTQNDHKFVNVTNLLHIAN